MVRRLFAIITLACMAVGCDNGPERGDDENSPSLCADNIDNDGDGAKDCEDTDCAAFCLDTEFVPDTVDEWDRKPNRGEVHDPGVYVSETPMAGAFALVEGARPRPWW